MSHPSTRADVARYSPLYFLTALGAGGLTVSFFMWLLFWTPHPGRPVPVFEDLLKAFSSGGPMMKMMIGLAWAGIAFFALTMVRYLIWNGRLLAAWSQTEQGAALRAGNNETQLLAAPLAAAMAINVGFIVGLVFVPGLWSIVEYLFPVAMIAFMLVGYWALALMGEFWGRIFIAGGFDCAKNNSFAQMLPAFAIAMVGVGLAAPAAMSQTAWIAGLSYVLSSFFIVSAIALAMIKLVLGIRALMENGANPESAPTFWIVVPILTVLGIAFMRQDHGLHAHFGGHTDKAANFSFLTTLLALQLATLLFGWVVLRRTRYFARFVFGAECSPGSYALVCPGVALSVMLHFFINKGLVAVGLIAKFGAAYWALSAIPVLLQLATILLVFRLNAQHFSGKPTPQASVPAE
ncbi:MAG: hypothetical protein MRY74_15940 [Neomegalonema sp.]|nr:hypothetical protein [Neomegalonema sp.]